MQNLQKLISLFYKNYLNKLTTIFLTVNSTFSISNLNIKLAKATSKDIK